MSILDKLGFSFLVMLIGMLIVFFGLIILICLIKLMSIVVGALTGKKKEKAAPAPAPVVVPEPVAEAAAEETGLESDELIAVITAALAAFNKDGSKTLVVRSVRRAAAKTPAWAKAGRADQLASRF